MPWHGVAQGEHLTQIADQYGFSDPQAIFDHPENKPLKDKKRNLHVLFPGDQLFVPDKEVKEVDAATGKVHTFKVKLPKMMLRVKLHDEDDQPFASKPYVLTVGGKDIEGKTDGDGKLEQPVPVQTREAKLVIEGNEIALRIGHLDPVDEDNGVVSRLWNLGYDLGEETVPGPRMEAALRRFQKANGLDVTGQLDDATRGKLQEKHIA